jgi:GNAT superfamily N-acetyltransferase
LVTHDNVDSSFIKRVLYEHFEPVSDRLPEDWEFDDFMKRMDILQVVDTEKNKACGMQISSTKGTMSMNEHIFIDAEYRRLGLAKMLMAYWIKNTGNRVKRYDTWILTDNTASINTHLSLGFKHNPLRKELFCKQVEAELVT